MRRTRSLLAAGALVLGGLVIQPETSRNGPNAGPSAQVTFTSWKSGRPLCRSTGAGGVLAARD